MNSSASSDRASGEIFLPITPVLTSGERILRRFMESLLGLVAVHWDHEPADRAAASWTAPVLWRFRLARLHRQSARRLAHSKTWRGFQRFMESLLSPFRMHWDPEPAWEIQSAAGAAHSKTWRNLECLRPTRQRFGVRRPSAAFDGSVQSEFVWFMESDPEDRNYRASVFSSNNFSTFSTRFGSPLKSMRTPRLSISQSAGMLMIPNC